MDTILVTTILGAVIIYCIYFMTARHLQFWKNRNIPYYDGGVWAFLCDVKALLIPTKSFDGFFLDLYRLTKGHSFCGVYTFIKPQLFLRDPEIIYNVMVKDFSHFADRPFPIDEEREPLSGHLLGLKGDRWRALRYKLAPTFTTGKLKAMIPQVTQCADDIIAYIKGKKGPMEARQIVTSFTLNLIGSVAFGIDVGAHKYIDSDEKSEFIEMSRRFFHSNKTIQLIKFVLFSISQNLAYFLGVKLTDDEMYHFFLKLVRDAIKHRKDTTQKRNDFLQLMINMKEKDDAGLQTNSDLSEAKPDENDKELLENLNGLKSNNSTLQFKFTDNALAANTFIFVSGGSETTATALTFSLYELAVNPHIQTRLQNEIDATLAEGKFDFPEITSMAYLDQFVSEVLRKYPPITDLQRECLADYRVPGTDYVIKKGDELIIPVIGIHMDAKYFPDPETFDPDRFQDPNNIQKGTYMPFGVGPRFCIAMRFAILVIKVYLARVMMQYSVKLNSKTRLPLVLEKNSFAKNVEGGVWVEFISRSDT